MLTLALVQGGALNDSNNYSSTIGYSANPMHLVSSGVSVSLLRLTQLPAVPHFPWLLFTFSSLYATLFF